MAPSPRKTLAVILAAGKGVRMKSKLPKVLTPLMGKPMVHFVAEACRVAKIKQILLVIGYQADLVRETMGSGFQYAEQTQQLGTGHALMVAVKTLGQFKGDILVLAGDTPLLNGQILRRLITKHQKSGAAATMMTAVLDQPGGYGRIVRKPSGSIDRIVEARDATAQEKKIKEVNTSHYCFKAEKVIPLLSNLNTNNDQGEYYLTDIIEMLVGKGEKVESLTSDDPNILLGVNNRSHLADIQKIMQSSICNNLMAKGVSLIDPASVIIETEVKIAPDTIIHPFTSLLGKTSIKSGSHIGPHVKLKNAVIGENCRIEFSVIEGRKIEDNTVIGPFAGIYGED